MKPMIALVLAFLLVVTITTIAGAELFSPTETAKYFNMPAEEIMELNKIDQATFTISLLVDLSGTSEIRFLEKNLPQMLANESYIQLNRPGIITIAFPCDSKILTLIYYADGENTINAGYNYFDVSSAEHAKFVLEDTKKDYQTCINDPAELVKALLYYKYRSEDKTLYSHYE